MPTLEKQDTLIQRNVDYETGEIQERVQHKTSTIRKHTTEEEYIKVYYNTFLASLGDASDPLSSFLVELGKRMTYSKDGQVVYLIKPVKEEIAQVIGKSLVTIKRMINRCEKLGLLIHKRDKNGNAVRGVYIVSPFVIAKGNWGDVRVLQLKFNAQLEELEITPLAKPKYIAETENKGFQLSDPESDDSDSK